MQFDQDLFQIRDSYHVVTVTWKKQKGSQFKKLQFSTKQKMIKKKELRNKTRELKKKSEQPRHPILHILHVSIAFTLALLYTICTWNIIT